MDTLGTILPTTKSLRATDIWYANSTRNSDIIALRAGLKDKVIIEGESRYYKDETHFAIVTIYGKLKWFEVRSDGVYAISKRG